MDIIHVYIFIYIYILCCCWFLFSISRISIYSSWHPAYINAVYVPLSQYTPFLANLNISTTWNIEHLDLGVSQTHGRCNVWPCPALNQRFTSYTQYAWKTRQELCLRQFILQISIVPTHKHHIGWQGSVRVWFRVIVLFRVICSLRVKVMVQMLLTQMT